METHRHIIDIKLGGDAEPSERAELSKDRRIAIFDLLEGNWFAPVGGTPGPFVLHLGAAENRLHFDIRSEDGAPLKSFTLPGSVFRSVIRDYFLVCESYYGAVKTASPAKIEAIDMGRRALHNEGAELLRDRLAGHVEIDAKTARQLFTLICVLNLR